MIYLFVYQIILLTRFCSAIWNIITDCDETFNYWEVIHYIVHGKGLQTWEYSPQYAIRSYFYLWFYTLPVYLYTYLISDKIVVFYLLRGFLAIFSTLCEVYFYTSLFRKFGSNVKRLTYLFSIVSSGMFISSTSVLPSSFSMYMTFLIIGAWLCKHYRIMIFAMGLSVLVGWPFSAIISVPIIFDLLFVKRLIFYTFKWLVIAGLLISLPMVAIDSYYYGKFVIAPLNIIIYNINSKHGPDLYGTEPWHYYFINLFLNFNFVALLSFLSIPLTILSKLIMRNKMSIPHDYWIILISLNLWFAIFFIQEHKEERFMFPIYPLICLSASLTLNLVLRVFTLLLPKSRNFFQIFLKIFIILYVLLSLMRILAIVKGFYAPINTFTKLSHLKHKNSNDSVLVCIGKEWHRFPNSFFLPSNKWKIGFLQSEFRGQLPQPFAEGIPYATRIIQDNFNDRNLEELSRYVNSSMCDFIIDSDFPVFGLRDVQYSKDPNWKILSSDLFLDVNSSPKFWRSFYLPIITYTKCKFVKYNLLKNKNIVS